MKSFLLACLLLGADNDLFGPPDHDLFGPVCVSGAPSLPCPTVTVEVPVQVEVAPSEPAAAVPMPVPPREWQTPSPCVGGVCPTYAPSYYAPPRRGLFRRW